MARWLSLTTLKWFWLGLAFVALLIVLLANCTSIDLWLADQAYDPLLGRFTAKHDFVYESILHDAAKKLLIAVWLCTLTIAWLPTASLTSAMRKRLRWIVVLAASNSALVSLLKHWMPHACPWDIARYGGQFAWTPVFASHPAGQIGHCFPAGHATSALWLSAFCLCWLPHAPRKAWIAYGLGLASGLALGWVQQLRGAHFLSHTLSAAWLMSALLLIALTLPAAKD